ncbi:MAG: trypsin-like peptidase domain-containing protein [Anaerolineales bacterium]|nr:trypsin-like peptidase domain-containing protein [Anaerolineales bacterium]
MKIANCLMCVILILSIIGCSGATDSVDPTLVPLPVPAQSSQVIEEVADISEPKIETVPSNAISSLQDVRKAVVQIESEGTFLDAQEGLQTNVAGRGSGFIIHEEGIAVTNNHVVTGAAILRVFIDGEDQPRNARVLGVSECSDLAVIDIDGDSFPYLQWYEGDIDVGLNVYAAGFPLGDPEYTLTSGIVSKARANGESSWASVDSVLEHDATINPGNSGGPLVNEMGQVVGINYAGASDTRQYYAIARTEALNIIEALRAGSDVTSLGINGFALPASDGTGLGIWVSSVESDSPAKQTGIEAGDVILKLQGLALTNAPTMADYCDILRTHEATSILDIDVFRLATDEYLSGQINGRELEVVTSFAEEIGEEVPQESTETAYQYVKVTDDTNMLRIEIPTEWSDVSTTSPGSDSIFDASILATTNFDEEAYLAPSVFFAVSTAAIDTYTEEAILDELDFSDDCTYEGRKPYQDVLYTGFFDVWGNCGTEDATQIVLSATPENRDFIALVVVHILSPRDLEALEHILDSFVVLQ